MEKIIDKLAALPPTAVYFSLEFFPPKTQAASWEATSGDSLADGSRAPQTFRLVLRACPRLSVPSS